MSYLNIPIIDIHIHVHPSSPDRALPTLKAHEEVVQEIFDKTGDEAITLIATGVNGGNVKGNATHLDTPLGYYLKHKCPQKIYFFGARSRYQAHKELNTQEFYLEQAKFRHAAGCDGFKCLDGLTKIYKRLQTKVSDPALDLYHEYLEQTGLPLLMHVGNPIEMFEKGSVLYTEEPGLPTLDELYDDVTELMTKFPKMTLILPHFFFMSRDLDKAEDLLNRWENLYFDLTPNIFMYYDFNKYPDEVVRSFFTRNCHKIIYGTDTFLETNIRPIPLQVEVVRDYFEKEHSEFLSSMNIRTLPLEPDILKKMYRDNFMKLVEPKPIPVQPAYVIKECQDLLAYESCMEPHHVTLLREISDYFSSLN